LDVLSKIAAQIKNAGDQKTIQVSQAIDRAFVEMSLYDKGIKNVVKKYLEE